MPARHDVAVIGGGPAGCAAAIELRRLGVARVLVVDAGARPAPVGESIPPDTRTLIDRLGIADEFAAAGHERCPGNCSAWGRDELGHDDFVVHPHGHGWHLDRARFDADLARRAAATGATMRAGRVHAVDRLPDGGFRLDDGRSVREAAFVVDATGAAAAIARRLGALRRVHDRLACVAGVLPLSATSQMTALTILEAVRDGWWYAARLPGQRAVALLASQPEIVKAQRLDEGDRWRAALARTRHVAAAVGGTEPMAGGVVRRTATSAVTEPSAGEGWVAVGDAATAFDPLSSQGIHHALADGLGAAAVAAAWLDGDRTTAERYAEGVRQRFAEYLAVRDHLYRQEDRWAHEPFWSARREARIRPSIRSA